MNDRTNHTTADHNERLDRIMRALERPERRFDEFAGAYLNAKFPHGRPVDRWRRSA